jgi:hypothetical protein
MNALERETARLISSGCRQVTLSAMKADLARMGFRLDRSMDCRCVAKDLETGDTFPCITSDARQISTGAGFANTAADRTAPGWRELMDYRSRHFAIVQNAIFTI